MVIDDGNALAIRPEDVVIDDMFSAGWDFAVKVHLQGLHPESGGVVTLPATGMGSIDPDGRADVRIVTDRYGTLSR